MGLRILFLPILLITVLIFGCSKGKDQIKETGGVTPQKQRPLSYQNGKIFEHNGQKMLYGGEDSTFHFDIGNCSLKDEQFHYGIGRERFPALLQPEFISVEEADALWDDNERFLLARIGNEARAYSIKDLTRHEVVNDVIDGREVMAVYCILADLGAMYDRTYGDQTLTFALSGYTYFDPDVWDGLDGFILWDRDTESLWWPLIGKAVSGPLKGVKLQEMDKSLWKDTNWETIKQEFPNPLVLQSGQDYERPKTWPRFEKVEGITAKFMSTE